MQASPNLVHFWNDVCDDLTYSFFFIPPFLLTYALNISVHVSGAQESCFRPNGVYAKRRCVWHMRDQIYVLAFPLLY